MQVFLLKPNHRFKDSMLTTYNQDFAFLQRLTDWPEIDACCFLISKADGSRQPSQVAVL